MEYDYVKFGEECRKKLIEGVDEIVDAITVTYGPNAKNAIIRCGSNVTVTKDGYHTGSVIFDPDPYRMMGIILIQNLCRKIAAEVGDGSSTVAILARDILHRFKDCKDPIATTRDLKRQGQLVIEQLQKQAVKVKSKQDLIDVATISANNDGHIGELVADAFDKVGVDGIVTLEESDEITDRLEFTDGFRIDRGYISASFANTPKGTCELEDVMVYISDVKLDSVKKVCALADQAVKEKKSLLLIAPEFDSEITVFLTSNKELLKSCAIISPNAKAFRETMLEDMDILLGESKFCKKVIVTKQTTTFLGCNSDQSKIDARIKEIRAVLDTKLPELDANFHLKRLANFTSGIATIYVGGYSKTEIKERYDRFEDATRATFAALQGGILPGGGFALAKVAEHMHFCEDLSPFNEVLLTPQKLLHTENISKERLLHTGVLEPFLVAKTTLENAISTASMLLTADVAIINMNNDYME